jgi:hypothetical protein
MIRVSALAAAVLVVSSSICPAQELPKPNLSETNIRKGPDSNPSAGTATDYLLISADTIGKDTYLRFDTVVAEIKVDDPNLFVVVPSNDPRTVVLRPQGTGRTRVLVFGVVEGLAGVADLQAVRSGGELSPRTRLLYDANVAVGTRMVLLPGPGSKGGREIMDCAPGCYPSPIVKLKEPDQIIEVRGATAGVTVPAAGAGRSQ